MTVDEATRIYGLRYVGKEKNQHGQSCLAFVDLISGHRLRVVDVEDLEDGLLVARDPTVVRRDRKEARTRARKLSAEFHEFEPRKLHRYEYAWPKSLVSLGRCAQVDYVCDKFDGKVRRYFHEFEGLSELLVDPESQSDGTRLLIIRGDFEIGPEGLAG